MKPEEFICIFKDIIQSDAVIGLDDELASIEEWDSMAMMALIAYFDVKLQVTVTFPQLYKLHSVREIAHHVPGLEA